MPQFRATTWNVENLFRPAAGTPAADQQRYEAKLALLASTITFVDPDVIGFQEIGGPDELADLQGGLLAYGHSAISDFPDNRGIRVAFLSKLPIISRADIVTFPQVPALQIFGLTASGSAQPISRMGRGALRVRVTKGSKTIDVIVAHLKSKLLTFTAAGGGARFSTNDEGERAQVGAIALNRRTAEATTVRFAANSLLVGNATTPLVVLGDFNDVPDAQTSLLLAGPSGSEIGTGGFARPDQGDDARLFNIAPAIPEARRYSRIHRGRRELLDQIFASEELFPVDAQGKRRGPVGADSFTDFAGSLPSIEDNPNARLREIAPDHAPVSATFEL